MIDPIALAALAATCRETSVALATAEEAVRKAEVVRTHALKASNDAWTALHKAVREGA